MIITTAVLWHECSGSGRRNATFSISVSSMTPVKKSNSDRGGTHYERTDARLSIKARNHLLIVSQNKVWCFAEWAINWWVNLNSRLHRYAIVEHVITEPSALICCNSPGSLNFLLKANLKARLETGCIVCVCSLWGSYFRCFALIKLSLHSITSLNPKSSQAAVLYDILWLFFFLNSLVSEPSKLKSDWKTPSRELLTMWSVKRTWG